MVRLPDRCELTGYPELIRTHRLRLVAVVDGVDGLECHFVPRQPELPGLPPAEPAESAPQAPQPPTRPSALALILAGMLRQAAAHPGSVQRKNLFHGLRVDLMVGVDGQTRLMIARKSVYPSDAEWVTILSYWPYDPPGSAIPEKFEFKTWLCMRASWPTPGGRDE